MDDKVMEKHNAFQAKLEASGKLGPHLRLMPTSTAMTIRGGAEPMVLDEAIGIAREFATHASGGALELHPVMDYAPGSPTDVTEVAWIGAQLGAARPRALGALLRYFRDLDISEEAFQEASLRALKTWPVNGPPRDPPWLIFVGRNVALDQTRRKSKQSCHGHNCLGSDAPELQ